MICICMQQPCSLPYTFVLVDACRSPLPHNDTTANCVKI